MPTANGFDVVCIFVNYVVNEKVIGSLKGCGIKLIALCCARAGVFALCGGRAWCDTFDVAHSSSSAGFSYHKRPQESHVNNTEQYKSLCHREELVNEVL